MGRLTVLLRDVRFQLWFAVVLPTNLIFLATAFAVRVVVLAEVKGYLRDATLTPTLPFDEAFDGSMVLWCALIATLLSTVLTYFIVQRGVQPLKRLSAVARQISLGNYGVQAEASAWSSDLTQSFASDINAIAESLERTERLRRELVSNLAHEIRTPLTNLQGYIEALRDGVIPANSAALSSVHEEVMRMVRLVDALHVLARADAMKHQPPRREPANLDGLVQQLVRVIRPNAEGKGIRLLVETGARSTAVPVHADSIAQVLRNLLKNAVQYTEPGGVIRIQTWVLAGAYHFSCINSGAGIPEEELPFIFQRFYRTEKAKHVGGNNVGLGLAIVKELVEAHGGQVGASSKGGWTTLWFELPMDPA